MRLRRFDKRNKPDFMGHDHPDLAVFCDAGSHPKWWLASISVASGGALYPVSVVIAEGARFTDRSEYVWRYGLPYVTYIVGEEVLSEENELNGPARPRWNLTCVRCGDSVTVRDERLEPVVHKLVRNGVTELSLRGLRVALGSYVLT